MVAEPAERAEVVEAVREELRAQQAALVALADREEVVETAAALFTLKAIRLRITERSAQMGIPAPMELLRGTGRQRRDREVAVMELAVALGAQVGRPVAVALGDRFNFEEQR